MKKEINQCPVCGILEQKLLFCVDEFCFVRCCECGVIYSQPHPGKGNWRTPVYPNEDKKKSRIEKILETKLTQLTNWRRLAMIFHYKKKGRMLDLGCGTGSFIAQVNSKGWGRYGVDPHLSEIDNRSGTNGPKFYAKNLFDCYFPEKFFDVVSLWHVIEHISAPEKVLKEIGRILKDDGILVISTPTTDGLGFKIAGKDWYHVNVPMHMFLFNFASFKKILERSGFLVIKTNYRVLEYAFDLFRSFEKAKFKNCKYIAFLLLPFFLVLRVFLSLIKQGETMEVVCVKKTKIN